MVHTTAKINLFLAVINLLPMNPLDGGKLFQLMLAYIVPEKSATQMTGILGIITSVFWVPTMIACFLSFGVVLFILPSIRAHWQMARI